MKLFDRKNWTKKPRVLYLVFGAFFLLVGCIRLIGADDGNDALGVIWCCLGILYTVQAFYRTPEAQPPEDIPAVERYAKSLQSCTDGELASILADALRGDEVKEAARQLLSERAQGGQEEHK